MNLNVTIYLVCKLYKHYIYKFTFMGDGTSSIIGCIDWMVFHLTFNHDIMMIFYDKCPLSSVICIMNNVWNTLGICICFIVNHLLTCNTLFKISYIIKFIYSCSSLTPAVVLILIPKKLAYMVFTFHRIVN